MALINEVRSALVARFPGADIRLKRLRGNHVGGSIVWEGFDRQMQIDRQVQLHKALQSELSDDQRSRVSLIMALTPEEEEVLSVS